MIYDAFLRAPFLINNPPGPKTTWPKREKGRSSAVVVYLKYARSLHQFWKKDPKNIIINMHQALLLSQPSLRLLSHIEFITEHSADVDGPSWKRKCLPCN